MFVYLNKILIQKQLNPALYDFLLISLFFFLNFPQLPFIQAMIAEYLNMPGIGLNARSIQVDKCDKCRDGNIYKIRMGSDEKVVNQMGKGFESRKS